jgi:hypothetical protein
MSPTQRTQVPWLIQHWWSARGHMRGEGLTARAGGSWRGARRWISPHPVAAAAWLPPPRSCCPTTRASCLCLALMRPPNRYPRHSNVGRSLTHSLSRSSCRGVIERAQSSASLQSGRFERPPPQRLGKAPLCTGDARAVRRRGHVTVGAAAAQTGPRQLRRDCFTHPVCGTPPPCTASPAVTASVSWGHLSPRWRPRWERWNLPR